MVGVSNSNSNSEQKLATLVDSARAAHDMPSKLDYLRRLRRDLVDEQNAVNVSEVLPGVLDLLNADSFAPVRKFATE